MKYLPFLNGKYSVAPGLQQLDKAVAPQDKLVFQVDPYYESYLANKERCREESIRKYYCTERLSAATAAAVNQTIVRRLVLEHPTLFDLREQSTGFTLCNRLTGETVCWENDWVNVGSHRYPDLLDALCSQVQEDIAICQLNTTHDYMAAIHLCAPNHWAAAEKTGKSFTEIHQVIPGMQQPAQQSIAMLQAAVYKGPFTRFAWGLASDDRLNHHPLPPPGITPEQWQGRAFEDNDDEIYVRAERQNLVGLPAENAFLFTIRTYFYPVSTLLPTERAALLHAVESMSPESLAYKGLTGKIAILRKKLLSPDNHA